MKYAREILRDVEGYVPGEQPRVPGLVKLNTNENPYPPSPKVIEAIRALATDAIKNYPDPVSLALRRACAERYGYPDESWVIAGNGMDEILALALRTFTDPDDVILSVSPTYVLYDVLARLHGAQIRSVPLDDDFEFGDAMYGAGGRLAFVPRPNSPSGVCPPRADIERFCQAFDGIVVIDEAYADFADDICMDFPKTFENVIVTRSFSKSFSLAGMRLGIGIARPELIAEFLKTKDSYNLNAATQAAGLAAIQDYAWMEQNVAKVVRTRTRLVAGLEQLGFNLPRSQSNFVLATCPPEKKAAPEVFRELRERNVLVRYFDSPRLADKLRITVGTDEQTEILLEALAAIVGQ